LLEHTYYFPGWTITVDSKPTTVAYSTRQHPARMVVHAPKGLHLIEVAYSDIPALASTKLLSIITVLCILLYSLIVYSRSLIRVLRNWLAAWRQ